MINNVIKRLTLCDYLSEVISRTIEISNIISDKINYDKLSTWNMKQRLLFQ